GGRARRRTGAPASRAVALWRGLAARRGRAVGAGLPQPVCRCHCRRGGGGAGGQPGAFWPCRSGAVFHVAHPPLFARLSMLLALMKKELLALSRDIHGMGALFIMPMVFIIVMSMALKDVYTPAAQSLAYAVDNQDQSEVATRLI